MCHVSPMTILRRLLSLEHRILKHYDASVKHFWPESLTPLFPNTGSNPTAAILIPSHPVDRTSIRIAEVPLATSSANSQVFATSTWFSLPKAHSNIGCIVTFRPSLALLLPSEGHPAVNIYVLVLYKRELLRKHSPSDPSLHRVTSYWVFVGAWWCELITNWHDIKQPKQLASCLPTTTPRSTDAEGFLVSDYRLETGRLPRLDGAHGTLSNTPRFRRP